MKIKPLHIFIFLVLLFLTYSFTIYLQPGFKSNANDNMAANGKLVWQKYNCQSCHQLYGLGGYLGPDLTNEMSKPNAKTIVLSMLKNGVSIMPVFNLSDNEQDELLQFLSSVNNSGNANPKSFKYNLDGTIEQK